jgi:hypothetical protein
VTGNGYFENVWAWTADHDIDDPNQTQINVITGRSVLIESQGPSWFYATAAEHSLLYQYNIANASDIYLGMVRIIVTLDFVCFWILTKAHIFTDPNGKSLLFTTFVVPRCI